MGFYISWAINAQHLNHWLPLHTVEASQDKRRDVEGLEQGKGFFFSIELYFIWIAENMEKEHTGQPVHEESSCSSIAPATVSLMPPSAHTLILRPDSQKLTQTQWEGEGQSGKTMQLLLILLTITATLATHITLSSLIFMAVVADFFYKVDAFPASKP